MNRKSILTGIALVVLAFGSGTKIQAQEKAKHNGLTQAELHKMLDNMGFEPKTLGQLFEIQQTQDDHTVFIRCSLSPDKSLVWLQVYLFDIKDMKQVPAQTWVNLLAENAKHGTAQFSVFPNPNRLFLTCPVSNHDLTPAKLRLEIDRLAQATRATMRIWHPDNFRPVAPATSDPNVQP